MDGTPICAALDIFDADTLWGRYWGATEYVPGLHFEACYYQAIDFCIERRIARFEGGAAGRPQARPRPRAGDDVVGARDRRRRVRRERSPQFCARERVDVAHAIDELDAARPFRNSLPDRGQRSESE